MLYVSFYAFLRAQPHILGFHPNSLFNNNNADQCLTIIILFGFKASNEIEDHKSDLQPDLYANSQFPRIPFEAFLGFRACFNDEK